MSEIGTTSIPVEENIMERNERVKKGGDQRTNINGAVHGTRRGANSSDDNKINSNGNSKKNDPHHGEDCQNNGCQDPKECSELQDETGIIRYNICVNKKEKDLNKITESSTLKMYLKTKIEGIFENFKKRASKNLYVMAADSGVSKQKESNNNDKGKINKHSTKEKNVRKRKLVDELSEDKGNKMPRMQEFFTPIPKLNLVRTGNTPDGKKKYAIKKVNRK